MQARYLGKYVLLLRTKGFVSFLKHSSLLSMLLQILHLHVGFTNSLMVLSSDTMNNY